MFEKLGFEAALSEFAYNRASSYARKPFPFESVCGGEPLYFY